MPNLTTVVLTDAAATPVDHTFKPRGIDQGVASLVETTGVPIGESRLTLSHNRNQSGRIRAVVKMAIPVVQDAVVGGVTRPTVVRTNYVDITFNFDPSSTTQDRANLVKFVSELTKDTQTMMNGFLVDLEGLF